MSSPEREKEKEAIKKLAEFCEERSKKTAQIRRLQKQLFALEVEKSKEILKQIEAEECD